MTYCLGWKTNRASFLIADVMVTSRRPLSAALSSFGELHSEDGGRTVEEAALKIFDLPDAAVAFAGDSDIGFSAVEVLHAAMARGQSPRKALAFTVSSITPLPRERSFVLLLADCTDGAPSLTLFNGKELIDPGNVVQLGSLKEGHMRVSEAIVGQVLLDNSARSDRPLVSGLAWCQSYGIRDYIVGDGAGGAFCGLWVDESGCHWQPDIFYGLYTAGTGMTFTDINPVIATVCESAFAVRTTVARPGLADTRCFMNHQWQKPRETAIHRGLKAVRKVEQVMRSAKYGYVVLFNRYRPIVIVVEMNGQTSSRDLTLYPHPSNANHGKMSVSERLLAEMIAEVSQGDTNFSFFPFEPGVSAAAAISSELC